MSGTSADGLDAVLLELPGFPAVGEGGAEPPPLGDAVPRGRVLEHTYAPYPDDLRAWVLEAMRGTLPVSELTQLHFALGEFYATHALELAKQSDLIASHGQTVYHIPRVDQARGWTTRGTLQIGEPSLLMLEAQRPVASDFRSADLAAGGQAAPLVPFADWVLFSEDRVRRSLHNLGGISNLTYLPGTDPSLVLAFDTGPANALVDEAMGRLGQRFDPGGAIAGSGQTETNLVKLWLEDAYFDLPPPKSTGREHWTLERLQSVFELSPKDMVASVTAFSALSVANQYERFVLNLGLDEMLIAGGGTQNASFMAQLQAALPNVSITKLENSAFGKYGFTSATREAAAFAVLGYYAAQGWRNTLPHTTGATRAVVAGKLSRP
jgi:anhydro-N-acetylmuramic acid kinase